MRTSIPHAIDQQSAWDQVAENYQRRHDWGDEEVHYGPLAPDEDTLGLLGQIEGRRVLVLGCGDGANAVALARKGAIVTGVDISPAQLRLARQRAAGAAVSVTWHQADASDLSSLRDGTFDLILSINVFPYVEEIAPCLQGCQRLLAPQGRLLFSLDHPVRPCFWDAERMDEGVLPSRHYGDKSPLHWPFADTDVMMVSHPRTIAAWFDLLHQAGFQIERLLEVPLPDGLADEPWADEYTMEIARYLPQTLIIRARKDPQPT